MTDKLIPCPFGRCRAKAELASHTLRDTEYFYIVADHDPECPLYHAIMNDNDDRQLVIDRWNAR